jgi:hypothetical protein
LSEKLERHRTLGVVRDAHERLLLAVICPSREAENDPGRTFDDWQLPGHQKKFTKCTLQFLFSTRLTHQPSPPKQAAEKSGSVPESTLMQQLLNGRLRMRRVSALQDFPQLGLYLIGARTVLAPPLAPGSQQ